MPGIGRITEKNIYFESDQQISYANFPIHFMTAKKILEDCKD